MRLHHGLLPQLALLLVALLALTLTAAAHPSSTGGRVLVVTDDQAAYSTFLAHLTSRGYHLSFKSAKEAQPALVEHDVRAFDHLLLLTPSSKTLANDLSPQSIVSYLRDGGNVLFGLDSRVSELFRDLAREFALEFDERSTALVDHFRFDPTLDQGNHTTVRLGAPALGPGPLTPGGLVPNTAVFSLDTLHKAKSLPLLYRGVAHRLGANPLAFPLVLPPATAYSSETPEILKNADRPRSSTSYSTPQPVTTSTTSTDADGQLETVQVVSTPAPVPTVVKIPNSGSSSGWTAKGRAQLEPLDQKKELFAGAPRAGVEQAALVSAFQLLHNSARAVFVGSTDMLRNEFLSDKYVRLHLLLITLPNLLKLSCAPWRSSEPSMQPCLAT